MFELEISYLAAFLAGILSFLSPCVLPLVPPYLCFLGGVTLDQMTQEDQVQPGHEKKIFGAAIFFVLGFSAVFIALGATASTIGRLVADHMEVLGKLAGVTIILLGVHFLGIIRVPFLYREVRMDTKVKPENLASAFIIGLAFAFGWTPCVGPVLATILFVAGSDTSVLYGVSLLAIYSFGLGFPFLLAAFAVKPFMKFMGRFRSYLHLVERFAGLCLIITGSMFLTGTFSELSFWLLEMVPALGRLG